MSDTGSPAAAAAPSLWQRWISRLFARFRERQAGRRVRTPTVIQMEAVECGAAALAIVLGYHGRVIPLETLREECGVSRDGSKATNVLRASRKFGMVAKGFKHSPESLKKLTMPVILFWNFNHFLVLEGFGSGDRVYLNDPASGPRTVTWEEFDASFTGVTLTFTPGPDFKRGGAKEGVLWTLIGRLRGHETAVAYLFICSLLLVVPGLVIPTFTRVFIDDVLIAGRTGWVAPLITSMLATVLVYMGLTWLQRYYLVRFETKLSLQASGRFLMHVIRLPVAYFAQRFAGEIGSRVAVNDEVANLLGGQFAKIAFDAIAIIFFGALMFLYDPVLAAFAVGFAALNVVVLRLAERSRKDANRRVLQEQGKVAGASISGLSMMETIKATGGEDEFFQRWAGYQSKALKAMADEAWIANLTNAAPPLLDGLTTVALLGIGGWRVMDGHLTIGMLVAFQGLAGNFGRPISSLVAFGSSLQRLEGSIGRLDDVLRYPVDPRYDKEPDTGRFRQVAKLRGEVELRGVSFGYSPLDPPLIEEFSLAIKPGQRVALVGGSGSGKSTVAKLVSGLYRPWKGETLFDGEPFATIPNELFQNSVTFVDQDIALFQGTVRDNITLWDGSISEADVCRAARDAQFDEVVLDRPGGFLSMVEEGGANFSGGQRQRLEIARALVNNPTVLVLDEATSALDATTEQRIDENLRRRGCACLIIAHRLSTVRDADQIIVMEQGKIVQRGTFEELTAVDGQFRQLIKE